MNTYNNLSPLKILEKSYKQSPPSTKRSPNRERINNYDYTINFNSRSQLEGLKSRSYSPQRTIQMPIQKIFTSPKITYAPKIIKTDTSDIKIIPSHHLISNRSQLNILNNDMQRYKMAFHGD